MSRCSDYVNKKTQEEAVGMIVVKGGRYPREMEFATIFADAAMHVARLDLTSTDYRVLFGLIGSLTWANFIRISQKRLARRLKLAPSNVSASIKRLIQTGLIAKAPDPHDDDKKLLRLSLSLTWRGRPKEWTAAVNGGETLIFTPIPIAIDDDDDDGEPITKPRRARKAAATAPDNDNVIEGDCAA